MQKQKTHKGIQRLVCICIMFIMAFLFALTPSKEAKAKSKSSGYCTLQSVTIEVGGKEYVCDGSLNYIPVEYNADWKELLKTVKIIDYQVLVNDCCSHVEGHDSVEAGLYELLDEEEEGEFKYRKFLTYEDGGQNIYTDVDDSLDQMYYEVMFCLDGDNETSIIAYFKKECSISYELDGGSFLEGMDVPDTCGAGKSVKLISPVKRGSQFLGWTLEGQEDSEYVTYYEWNGGEAPTFVANWADSAAPIDIGTVGIKLKSSYGLIEGGATPKPDIYIETEYQKEISLTEGWDYILSYENNDKICESDSDNPPTVVITGIGKYTGTVRKEFTITKDNVRFIYNYSSGFACLNIVKGKPLSSIDLSKFYAYSETYDGYYVEGTFSWENEDYIPDADVGEYFDLDPDETHCNLIFTPDNLECCDKTTVSMAIAIHVYQGSIADCQITFESGQQSYLYNGEAIKPEVIVKDDNTTLIEGEDYEVSYSGYINAASSTDKYAPTVTIKGIGNYTGTQKLTYTIAIPVYLQSGSSVTLQNSTLTYGETLSKLTFNSAVFVDDGGNVVEGKIEWKEPSATPDIGTTSATWVFKPDNEGYAPLEGKVDITVSPATPYIKTKPTAAAITYGQTLGDSGLSGGVVQNSESDTTSVKGTFTWKEAAAKPTMADSNKTEYVVEFTPDDTEHYNSVETKITLTVNMAVKTPNMPENTMNVSYTNKKVSDLTLPEGWIWKDTDKTKELEVGKAVTATAIYNGADKGNYVTESVEVSIIRQACTHTWDAGVVTKEATPTEKGEKTYTCTVCKTTRTEEIPALGAPAAGTTDTSDDGTATYKVTASDLTQGTVAYVAPTNKNATTVSVPATVTIDGVAYKVTSVADNAFLGNKKLTKVTIGSNITTVGKKAFYKCTKLKTVKIGTNVTSVGSNAFYGCSKLTTVTIGSKVTTISDKAFYKCTALTKITIPSKVKKIGKEAFYGCKKLKTITIQTTKLTSSKVGSKAFKGIYSKATIKVPKSKLTSYQKILKAKGCGSKVTISK